MTAKKWQFLKNKNEYGYMHRKVRKYVCMRNSNDLVQVDSNNLNELRKQAEVETELGKLESSEKSTLGTTSVVNNREGSRMFGK